jgi:hypothetical protein
MSYVVTALTPLEKITVLNFLHEHDVRVPPSGDLQAFASLSDRTAAVLGVVAFTGFWGRVCSVHLAGEGNWVNRNLIWRSFDYPFRQVGVQAVLAPISAGNARSLNFAQRMGFKEVHRIRDGWADDVDLIILQLLREDCHWLNLLDKRFAH